jgi:hypothetical protein
MEENNEDINVTINVKKITKLVTFAVKNWHFVVLLFGGLGTAWYFIETTYQMEKTYPQLTKTVDSVCKALNKYEIGNTNIIINDSLEYNQPIK